MGEDAHLEEADEGYGLSPVHDESLKFDDDGERWICSIDGSCVTNKGVRPSDQCELQPCSVISSERSVAPIESATAFPTVVLDDSEPLFKNLSRRQQPIVRSIRTPIALPQPMDGTMVKRRLTRNKSSSRVCREMSPIARVSSFDSLQKSAINTSQIYDPLRRATSQISLAFDNGFSAELKSQGDKLMNGLKAILKERLAREVQPRPPSNPSTQPTLVTALSSRAGSASSLSTGRDALTREVRLLREALDGINFIDRAQRSNSPFPKGDETIPDSFTMPDEVVSIGRPASGSRGTSAVEQARLSSRGSIQLLSDNAIRDNEHRSDGLTIRRFRIEGGPDHNSENHLREQGVNTHKVPVRHVVITHRVKHELDHSIGRTRFHIGSHHPEGKPHFHPFKLRTTLDNSQQIMDVDSIPHLGKRDETRDANFDGRAARATIHGEEEKETEHHPHKQRKGGGKRGRPVLVGRSLYSRGRVHFRPRVNFHPLPRGTSSEAEADSQESSPLSQERAAGGERHDAAVMTEEPEIRDSANAKADEVDDDKGSPSTRRKSPDTKKLPFVGSGLKGADTFSIVGNQQQVMKVTSTRFQEWLPLVRSIIYDSRCKDYAQALRRDLARQKRSHSEQMRLLQLDLVECRSESERREIRDDIARLKQQWTAKHDRVLSCLNELISKGGVWSKVQQLRTIHSALVA
ncbi:hypothetical protein V3C99_005843 [Haemonchus contortus]